MYSVKLVSGVMIPCMGYGTGVINFPSIHQKVKDLKKDIREISLLSKVNRLGVSLIDTSDSYGKSQKYIGKYVTPNREKIFICSKISNRAQYLNQVSECFEKMLAELKTDYIDLLLLHWPVTEVFVKSWKVLENLYKSKKVKAIGMANCNIHHLKDLMANCEIPPMINQIECHPLFTQELLREYCNSHDIKVMAYTPTGRMDARLNISPLKDIAYNKAKSIPQIIMRWHLQLGNIPIVNTSKKQHLMENIDIFDFELSKDDMEVISGININSRLRFDPDNCDFTKL